MPEIKINQSTTQKDKVFFRGTANLSNKEAESFNRTAEAAKTEAAEVTETAAPAAKKGK